MSESLRVACSGGIIARERFKHPALHTRRDTRRSPGKQQPILAINSAPKYPRVVAGVGCIGSLWSQGATRHSAGADHPEPPSSKPHRFSGGSAVGSVRALGAWGREFESRPPDHLYIISLSSLLHTSSRQKKCFIFHRQDATHLYSPSVWILA